VPHLLDHLSTGLLAGGAHLFVNCGALALAIGALLHIRGGALLLVDSAALLVLHGAARLVVHHAAHLRSKFRSSIFGQQNN